jgi:hypothetical protein
MKKKTAKMTKSERRWWSRELMLVATETVWEWGVIEDGVRQFIDFILARNAVRASREAGQAQPWSSDPILQSFHFCNVNREDDRTTRWLAANWRAAHLTDPDLWFALVLARRCINLPEVLSSLGYPNPWNPDHYVAFMADREKAGEPSFNSVAYRLSFASRQNRLAEFQARKLLNPLWETRETLRPRPNDTLATFHERLTAAPLMDSFYAGQVVADLKYAQSLRNASDWWDFAAPERDSLDAMNRVTGCSFLPSSLDGEDWIRLAHPLREVITPVLIKSGIPRMHLQDLEHSLRQFHKYEGIRLGENKGRKFAPNPNPLPSGKD